MNVSHEATYRPGGYRPATVQHAVTRAPVPISHMGGSQRAGANDVFANSTGQRSRDLAPYRVPSRVIEGVEPDRNGVYIVGPNGAPPVKDANPYTDSANKHFVKIGGDAYRVGGYNGTDNTWRVLGSGADDKGPLLEQASAGEWRVAADQQSVGSRLPDVRQPPIDPRPPGETAGSPTGQQRPQGSHQSTGTVGNRPSRQPRAISNEQPPGGASMRDMPALRERVMQAIDTAIGNTRKALSVLGQTWSKATLAAMRALFGDLVDTEEGRNAIKRELGETLQGLEGTKAKGGSNLGFRELGAAGAVAYHNSDRIDFSPGSASRAGRYLNELVVHEHAHTSAGSDDGWYLNDNFTRKPNFGGQLKPFVFANAVNNADTLAKSVTVLANNASA
jgi:hypothetical protein